MAYSNEVRSDSLLSKLRLDDLDSLLRSRRLRLAGHVKRRVGLIKQVCEVTVVGARNEGRPKKTLGQCFSEEEVKIRPRMWRDLLSGKIHLALCENNPSPNFFKKSHSYVHEFGLKLGTRRSCEMSPETVLPILL